MIRILRQRRAIKSIVRRLPLVIHRQFGPRSSYSIDQVNRALDRSEMDSAFAAYAHALLCNREDFDAYYGPLNLRCDYLSLRRKMAKRFLSGIIDFDAQSVYRYALDYGRQYISDEFCESGLGQDGATGVESNH